MSAKSARRRLLLSFVFISALLLATFGTLQEAASEVSPLEVGPLGLGSWELAPPRVLAFQDEAEQHHLDLFKEQRFPSATTCKTCHPDHYREWSVSAHAYAQMSPVFNAMHGKILKLTNGTNGDFCIRCHTPVGMNLEEPEFISNIDRHPTSREGITCIACHRLDQPYGKISGRLAIVEGSIYDPVYGPSGGEELRRVVESGEYGTNTDPGKSGRAIHSDAKQLDQMTESGLCGTCHDVNLVNGFRLEEAFSEYKNSPAARNGISCQDCHMGKVPGVPEGYDRAPAAVVGGQPTRPRKRTNHMFAGPDYSIIHPGIFPHSVAAARLATIPQWLEFDYKAGWGTDEFERNLPEGYEFPERWALVDDRYEARELLRDNLDLLDEIAEQRTQVLRAGYQLGEVEVEKSGRDGIRFKVEFRNGTDGHNVPTGFDAERLVWIFVTVTDRQGKVVFQSGDLDPNGDVRDTHSLYVHNGELPLDKQLFSLQSRFLTRMVRGGEREQVLAVNYSPDPLPFLRPSTSSTILTGRPAGARKHRKTIEPLGSRWAKYQVKRSQLEGSQGPYKARIQIKAAMVPVNLIQEIQDVGFDYGMSPRDVAQAVVDGHLVLWDREVDLSNP
ncbi:MAG TPA: multiheme c-type cytochrome [Acidobacteriota bacterium]|nr:multiheme c-type cytochrome [Acidobacteriota bacterium]